MMRLSAAALLLLGLVACQAAPPNAPPNAATPSPTVSPEVAAWKARADGVTITRDDWGIPHVRAKSDADAIFGLMYAQAEDDFNRIETNFINSQGRLAEAEGEKEIYRDLRMKLFIDPIDMKAQYEKAPDWLKKLMHGWADGLNFYLATHPEVKPRVIAKFEPWMALSFSEGSIGGDIEKVDIAPLASFYGNRLLALMPPVEAEPTGSNGFAIAPKNSAHGKALLVINPHTSFFFREEAQVTSDEGLNVYGALTWGQFFVYQGFNEKAGWMHTSSGVDNIDEYALTIVKKDNGVVYQYGNEQRPFTVKTIVVPYRTANGMATKEFTVYRSHFGPVVRAQDGQWIAVRLMEEPLKALIQSFARTKAQNIAEFKQVMKSHTNSTNNTLFADAEGNIAYFHSNFVPKRNPKFDWTRPVDGSDPATEWQGVHSIDESPNVENPSVGWVYNTNNWPYTAAGADSPKANRYPAYFDRVGENPRGVHAVRMMKDRKDFTLDSLIHAIFDSQQPEFEVQIPLLVKDWDQAPASNPHKTGLKKQIDVLRRWDYRWGVDSVAQTLAVFWAEELWAQSAAAALIAGVSVYEYMRSRVTGEQRLDALAAASNKIATDFGNWATPWGEINRFQRISPAIVHPFNDSQPSTPVGFASARWGSLAAFEALRFNGSRKIYGTKGNSFVAVVEFGKDGVTAKAVTAGGLSSDIASKHFNDQAARYVAGELREVYFYPQQLAAHTTRRYKPGH